jgi:hypothetical protein
MLKCGSRKVNNINIKENWSLGFLIAAFAPNFQK